MTIIIGGNGGKDWGPRSGPQRAASQLDDGGASLAPAGDMQAGPRHPAGSRAHEVEDGLADVFWRAEPEGVGTGSLLSHLGSPAKVPRLNQGGQDGVDPYSKFGHLFGKGRREAQDTGLAGVVCWRETFVDC